MKKGTKSMISLLCVAALTFSVAACGGETSSGKTAEAASFVALDINPSIELTVDENNVVLSAYGDNEDGKILLYDGDGIADGIVGENVETAVENITKLAVQLGYLDENNHVVSTSASGENAAALLSKINAEITATAQQSGLSVTTDAEGAYSLLRQLENFKAIYPSDAVVQALTVEDFRLALSASETGEITLEAAVKLDDSALVEMIANAHNNMEVFATQAFTDAKAQAIATYDKLVGMEQASVYMSYCATNLTLAPYASAYFMYQASACGFGALACGMDVMERINNYTLSDEQVALVLDALQLENNAENKALIANADGTVTVESVEAYADKLFKNSPAGQTLEEMKTDLTAALKTAETKIKQLIEEAKTEYKPQIEAVITAAKVGVQALESVTMLLPDVLKTALADFKTLTADVVSAITDGSLTKDELCAHVKTLKTKAEEILQKIENELSAEEKAALQDRKASVETKYADKKAEMLQKIADAETQARNYLQQERTKRTTA